MAASCQTYDQLASLFADVGRDIIRAEDFRSLLMSQSQLGAFSVDTDAFGPNGSLIINGPWQTMHTGRVDAEIVRTTVQPSENGLAVSVPNGTGGRGTITVSLDGTYLCLASFSLNVGRYEIYDPAEDLQFGVRAYRASPLYVLEPPASAEIRASTVIPFTDYPWQMLFVPSILEVTGTSDGSVEFSLVGRPAGGSGYYVANFRHLGLAVVRIR